MGGKLFGRVWCGGPRGRGFWARGQVCAGSGRRPAPQGAPEGHNVSRNRTILGMLVGGGARRLWWFGNVIVSVGGFGPRFGFPLSGLRIVMVSSRRDL